MAKKKRTTRKPTKRSKRSKSIKQRQRVSKGQGQQVVVNIDQSKRYRARPLPRERSFKYPTQRLQESRVIERQTTNQLPQNYKSNIRDEVRSAIQEYVSPVLQQKVADRVALSDEKEGNLKNEKREERRKRRGRNVAREIEEEKQEESLGDIADKQQREGDIRRDERRNIARYIRDKQRVEKGRYGQIASIARYGNELSEGYISGIDDVRQAYHKTKRTNAEQVEKRKVKEIVKTTEEKLERDRLKGEVEQAKELAKFAPVATVVPASPLGRVKLIRKGTGDLDE